SLDGGGIQRVAVCHHKPGQKGPPPGGPPPPPPPPPPPKTPPPPPPAPPRKAAEDKKAQALAELLSDTTERQQALADEVGSEVTGSLDDLIVNLVSQQWRRPPSARNGMSVEVLIEMLPDGTITNASVSRSSGDKPFDSSAVAAVRNVGRIPEMQQLPRATFDSLYRQRRIIFKPEDLSL
ncbi:cell envelope integrity protein TolA, partial [Pseudomonas aeruginosa]|uniref:cell envelope integrity protein TolA n=1 Tax=Pseudomonas aeruginosa TaxID=287 RepID=UPI0021F0B232